MKSKKPAQLKENNDIDWFIFWVWFIVLFLGIACWIFAIIGLVYVLNQLFGG